MDGDEHCRWICPKCGREYQEEDALMLQARVQAHVLTGCKRLVESIRQIDNIMRKPSTYHPNRSQE